MSVRIAVSKNREVEFSDYTFAQMDKYMKERYIAIKTSDLIDLIRNPAYGIIVENDYGNLYDGMGNVIDKYIRSRKVWLHYSESAQKICLIPPDPVTGNCFNLFITEDVSREEEERCRLEEWISTLTPLSPQSESYSEKKSGDKCEFCYR